MTALFATIDGQRVTEARLYVPASGVWFVDLELDALAVFSGAVDVRLGALALRGTVAPSYSGSFGLISYCRVLAGGAGWSRRLTPKHYHNDAGVKLSTVALDAAREVGERLEVPLDVDGRVGADFMRAAAPASLVLEQLLRGTPWWVDYGGATHIGTRPESEAGAGVELLDFDTRSKVASLALDDLRAVGIGSVLRKRLARPLVVQDLEVQVSKGALRVLATGKELAA